MNMWKGQVDHSKSLKRKDYWIGTFLCVLIGGLIIHLQTKKDTRSLNTENKKN